MTRITNFGRKRTYLESTIPDHGTSEETQVSSVAALRASSSVSNENTADPNQQPPKKKRKRTKKSQRTGNATIDEDNKARGPIEEDTSASPSRNTQQLQKKTSKNDKKNNRKGRPADKDVRSESRRRKRIAVRNADTTCFGCREKGHSARDCPKEGGNKSVGVCYRCGSTRHNLSKCKKREDPLDLMPFATCFVCNGKGHLASGCSQNKDKGVYPNGGCCKLCGDTTHLAKDCGIRKKDANALTQVIGVERNIGADEDDFHVIGRRKQELDKEDRKIEKIQKSMDVRVGAQSGGLKTSGKVPPNPKKVVFF